ncbi:MAG: hypothetical protein DRJ40_11765 [Thermoprotei archaeon]|nr:MAG: hypothetical protein DRJ40_11765 [Thermoprotei archaeon]
MLTVRCVCGFVGELRDFDPEVRTLHNTNQFLLLVLKCPRCGMVYHVPITNNLNIPNPQDTRIQEEESGEEW